MLTTKASNWILKEISRKRETMGKKRIDLCLSQSNKRKFYDFFGNETLV